MAFRLNTKKGVRFATDLHLRLQQAAGGVFRPFGDIPAFRGGIHGARGAEVEVRAQVPYLTLEDEAGNRLSLRLRGDGTPEKPYDSVRATNVLTELIRQEPGRREAFARAKAGKERP